MQSKNYHLCVTKLKVTDDVTYTVQQWQCKVESRPTEGIEISRSFSFQKLSCDQDVLIPASAGVRNDMVALFALPLHTDQENSVF